MYLVSPRLSSLAFLPSCSGGLQSVRPDDLVSHWFDTTAAAFTHAGPRGRVIRVMHLFKEMHPPLMSLPSRSKFSLAHSASQISQPELCFRLSPRAVLLTPHGVLEIARLPGVFGPSGDPSNAATHANSTFVSLTNARFPAWLRCVLGLSLPLDASFRIGLSDLVSYRCRPWASIVLRRFLPIRSPGSLSARGVLRVVVVFRRPCGRRSSIGFEDVSIGWVR